MFLKRFSGKLYGIGLVILLFTSVPATATRCHIAITPGPLREYEAWIGETNSRDEFQEYIRDYIRKHHICVVMKHRNQNEYYYGHPRYFERNGIEKNYNFRRAGYGFFYCHQLRAYCPES